MTSGLEELYLLVDFDNLDKKIVGTSLVGVVEHLLYRAATCLQADDATTCRKVHVRLYGGWYEDDRLTSRAEVLVADCPASPFLFSFRRHDRPTTWRVSVELAFSILSVPGVHLMHTYRRRQTLRGIGVADPIDAGCDPSRCRILGIRDLVKKSQCPDCGTPANRIIWRAEQKLVDVMLATDTLTLAASPDCHICLVSSDDDFWPALLHVSCNFRRIYHMHGVPGLHVKEVYSCHAQPSYIEIPLAEEPAQ